VCGVACFVISFCAAISTIEKGGKWERALSHLVGLCVRGVATSLISFNAAIQ
jgi:hypothetical protein